MEKAVWTGSISFGLVNVPVKLYAAASPKTVRFNQLSAKTGARIRQKRVDEVTGKEVAYEEIVKGYEISPGRYVLISSEELDQLAPKQTKTIELTEFVDLAEIDPMIYSHSYFIGPTLGSEKGYRLLHTCMLKAGRVGIGKLVLRSKESLIALRAADSGAFLLSTMVFADDVRDPSQLDLPQIEIAERELNMGDQLIEALTVPFVHSLYTDQYREQVMMLIEAKAAGLPAPVAEEEAPAPAADLLGALEATLASVRKSKAKPKKQAKPVAEEVKA